MKSLGKYLICVSFIAVFMAAQNARAEPLRILLYGDSLASGFGLPPDLGFSVKFEQELQARGLDAQISNHSLAGETSAGGLSRFRPKEWPEYDVLILELGANDMLRGIPPEFTQNNLKAILDQNAKPTYILGMRAFTTMGPNFVEKFNAIYPDLAEQYQAGLYPSFFQAIAENGIANSHQFLQSDRIHPNQEGIKLIASSVADAFLDWHITRPKAEQFLQ